MDTKKHADAGARLRRLRQARGLTVEQLSQYVGVHHSTVCRWEAGRSQPLEPYVPLLAAALGVTPYDVIDVCNL